MKTRSAYNPTVKSGLNYGLVSYWRLDESSGNASDSIGGNTLTNTSVTYSTGKIANGAVFNGSSSNLQTSTAITSGAFTISHWFKTSSASQQVMFNFPNAAGGSATQGYTLINAGNITAITGSGGSLSSPLSTYADNAFHHLVFTASGGTGVLYIDGSQVATGASTNIGFNWYPILGKNNGGNFFSGTLDEVGVWNRALTSTEVTELYNSTNGLQLPSQPLTTKAYYPLNGNSTDYSGNGNTGTDTAITYPQGKFGQAARFDGSTSKIILPTVVTGASDVTLSMWCYVTSLASFGSLIGLGAQTTGQSILLASDSGSTGLIRATVFGASNGTTQLPLNQWVLVTGVFTGGTASNLYINGQLKVASTGLSYSITGTNNSQIGGVGTDLGADSKVDEVIIESRAWTAAEVSTYYRKSMLNYGTKKSIWSNFASYILLAVQGTYTYTGIDSLFHIALSLLASVGTYTYTGIDSLFSIGKGIIASAGTYIYTGIDPIITSSRTMLAGIGSYTYTGVSAIFTKGYNMVAGIGTYILTGPNAILRPSNIWSSITKSVTSWTDGTKNSTTWTNQSKD